MRTASVISMFALCFTVCGCGDGTLEIKTKSNNPPAPVVVVEKPAAPVVVIEKPEATRETVKSSVTTRDGGTTRTLETKTTTP